MHRKKINKKKKKKVDNLSETEAPEMMDKQHDGSDREDDVIFLGECSVRHPGYCCDPSPQHASSDDNDYDDHYTTWETNLLVNLFPNSRQFHLRVSLFDIFMIFALTIDRRPDHALYCLSIMQTCPCNLYSLTPHFYIVKLRFTGVYIIFLFLL